MTLRQLLLFRQVVKHGFSVTAAAEALYTAQSGVSKQLKALADELGVELFEHEGKRLVGLTPVGEQVDAIAERVLRDTDEIRSIGRTACKDAGSRLRVVATRHTANAKVRDAVLQFQRTHPRVLLKVSEEQPETACQLVSAGEVEIGVVPEWHVDAAHLQMIPLEHWRLVVAVPIGHRLLEVSKISLGALADVPVACYDRHSASRRVVEDAFRSAGLRSPVMFELSSSGEILDYAESGTCVGIVAKSASALPRHRKLRILEADGLFPPLTTSIIIRRGAALSWAAQDFIELLRKDPTPS